MKDWWIYTGTGKPHDGIKSLPDPPSWRKFRYHKDEDLSPLSVTHGITPEVEQRFGEGARGAEFQASDEEIDMINAALYLRRPLFVTGKPGCGKSSLAYAVAYELQLGSVLHWPITTRVTLQDGLYRYDAIGRLQEASLHSRDATTVPDIGQYLRLGPLGTALLPTKRPRVLLIDEIDKSDIDLPNDLLNVFEEGKYDIPELARLSKQSRQVAVMPYDGVDDRDRVFIEAGQVRCYAFPFVVLTSNDEREFPPAFLRRCLRLEMKFPCVKRLTNIVKAHLGPEVFPKAEQLITEFIERRNKGDLATDQLLNAIYLLTRPGVGSDDKDTLANALLKYLTTTEGV